MLDEIELLAKRGVDFGFETTLYNAAAAFRRADCTARTVKMSSLPRKVRDLPLERRALLALRAAVRKAIAERTREGLPVYIWSGGKVVDISAKPLQSRSRRRPSALKNSTRKTR